MQNKLEMWAKVQRDGRPADYRWRPLFNAGAEPPPQFLAHFYFGHLAKRLDASRCHLIIEELRAIN